jgi:uncharacterized protein YcgL (UPF0745 family)
VAIENQREPGIEVCVYRSETQAETYVYLAADEEFVGLPQALQDQFGVAHAFLNFQLHEEKVLAQADAKKVLAALRDQGFYLQLPPPKVLPAAETPEQAK